jgi:signal peptidase I
MMNRKRDRKAGNATSVPAMAGTARKASLGTFVKHALREPSYVIPLVLIVLIFSFLRAYVIPSGSMIPTLVEGDRIIGIQQYFPNGHTFHAGDIATFYSNQLGEVLVKRVVAEGGDTVDIIGDTLYVNGEASEWQGNGTGMVQGEWVLADDEYFMMGDNRSNSKDSRWIGPVKANQMISKVICTYFPFDRMKLLTE